jgi:hypothetical protein
MATKQRYSLCVQIWEQIEHRGLQAPSGSFAEAIHHQMRAGELEAAVRLLNAAMGE